MTWRLVNFISSHIWHPAGVWLVPFCPIEGACLDGSIYVGQTLGLDGE